MISLHEAENEARKVVNDWSTAAAALGWLPGSQYFLAGADLKMVKNIADIFKVKHYNAAQITATMAASIGGKTVAHTLLDFVPIAGQIIKSGTAAAVTKGLGEIVIEYFKERSPLA